MEERGQETTVFICEDTLDGMLTAIWKALSYRVNEIPVRIEIGEPASLSLFCRYLTVTTDHTTAALAADTIRRRISAEVFDWTVKALNHFDESRADAVLQFLESGLSVGRRIVDQMAAPEVIRVWELAQKAGHEAHLFTGFVRFEERGDYLFGRIAPKCNVVPLIGEHFHERLSGENWMIVDERRRCAAVQKRLGEWYLVSGSEELSADFLDQALQKEHSDDYEKLWRIFFRTIAIEARENYRCQRNMMPLWYRRHLTEYKEGEPGC